MRVLSALHDIALFVETARTSSFSRASANLGVSPATLSRRIAAMEEHFNTRLFHRTTRKVELTDAGRRYFERCEALADGARLAQDALLEEAQLPSGHVRLSMPVELGVHSIGPLLPEFARMYPGINFMVDLSSTHRDLVNDQFDVAIRLGSVRSDLLVSRQIGWVRMGLYASKAYLDARGTPSHPTDLVAHDCIVLPSAQDDTQWRLTRGAETVAVPVSGRFAVTSQGLMHALCERGAGIATLAPVIWRESASAGRILPVLPEWLIPQLGVYAVTASRLQTASVRAFIDFLAERFTSI